MSSRSPLPKTKVVYLSHLSEVVNYKIDLEKIAETLRDTGHITQIAIVEAEIAGIKRTLDALKIRREVVMLTKLREEGKF